MTGAKAKLGWEDVRAAVLVRIQSRHWLPGALIPTEAALAAEFQCARATVNRALQDLAVAGLVERRRKSGTRVALLPVRKATLDIPVIRQDIEGRGGVYSFQLLTAQTATVPLMVAGRLGLQPGLALLHLVTLHLASGRAQIYEDRWLNPAAIRQPLPDFTSISANEWLVANIGFARGDIAFSASAASRPEAEALAIDQGTALFVTERCTWGSEAAITWVRLAHIPGYRLQTQI